MRIKFDNHKDEKQKLRKKNAHKRICDNEIDHSERVPIDGSEATKVAWEILDELDSSS